MNEQSPPNQDLLAKIVSLCKRRGFIFQSSEIYGGLRSAYDYGPLGVELKRNVSQEWWREMVHSRDDVVGIDASIMMHSNVWRASGHLAGFSDPLVDCLNCKERFRADKVPRLEVGTASPYVKHGADAGKKMSGVVGACGYVCPVCGCPELSDERQFNLMFKTSIGPIDPLEEFIDQVANKAIDKGALRAMAEAAVTKSAIYLRPETAQAMFVQFLNVQQTTGMKVPFGIAQIGKSFRNEITSEKFIFRTCEFEQMEMEYFIEPGTEVEWLAYWTEKRIAWWRQFANNPDGFRLRKHEPDELAHYADDCYDLEFAYPWGWDELEGIASRTNYDLTKHSAESGAKLSFFDQSQVTPGTDKLGYRFVPYVIEPAAGLTRGVLALLLDAYREEEGVDAEGATKTRVVLKLHPRLAPIKAAVLPLLKKPEFVTLSNDIAQQFQKRGINARCDEQQSIGKRYARHDEIGTPYCLTVDHQSLEDGTITIRDRDTTRQDRISMSQALHVITEKMN